MQTDTVSRIEILFRRYGSSAYEGGRRESVSAIAHALQCAQLAEWAGADAPLVAAALLHDIGHFSAGLPADDTHDDRHEHRALPWLRRAFGPAVTEPIRLHVAAKRYLVATDPPYAHGLSPASVHSLALQGGPMDAAERAAFEQEPYSPQAVWLRRWDDAAKDPTRTTPPLGYYLALVGELLGDVRVTVPMAAFEAD
jgi:phosphonate degradation associated HDIG domain protein